MKVRNRVTVAGIGAAAVASGIGALPTSRDSLGANAETWAENAAKWHQLPLLVVVVVAVLVAVSVQLDRRALRVVARSCAAIVALCGMVKAPWILGTLMYGAFLSAAGLASLCAILLWTTAIAILIGVGASHPPTAGVGEEPSPSTLR